MGQLELTLVLKFARKPRLSGSQALGHPGTAGNGGRAENRVGPPQAGSSLGSGKKGELWLVQRVESLTSWLAAGFSLGLVAAMVGSREGPSTGDSGSIGKGLLHGSPRQVLMKRGSAWF